MAALHCFSSDSANYFWDGSVRPGAKKAAKVVLWVTALVATSGIALIPLFLSKTRAAGFTAPQDSPSLLAEARLQAFFPQFALTLSAQIVIVIRAVDEHTTVVTEDIATWSRRLISLSAHDTRIVPFRPLIAGYFAGAVAVGLPPLDSLLQRGFVSADNKTTLITLLATAVPEWNHTWSPWAYKFWLMDFMREFCASSPPGVEVLLAGNFVTYFDQLRARKLEPLLMWAELRVLPMALLVLAVVIKELRLLLLPPVTLLVSFLAAGSVLAPVAFLVPLSTDLPPSVISVVIALSLDYSLFMLARFNENRALRYSIQHSIDIMIDSTGHTIVLSGSLIAVAYFGAMYLPEDNLRYAGLALGITTLVVVAVHATLMPSLLLLAGRTLTTPVHCLTRSKARLSGDRDITAFSPTNVLAPGGVGGQQLILQNKGGWFWLMRHIEQRPVTAVALIFMLFLPVLLQLPKLQATADTYAIVPEDIQSTDTLRSLQKDFVVGRFDPYVVAIVASGGSLLRLHSLLEPGGHAAMLQLAKGLWELEGVGSMLGPVWLLTEEVDWARSHNLPPKVRGLYRKVVNTHTNANGSAALLQIHTTFLPRGPGAADWVLSVRAVLGAWQAMHPAYDVSLTGGACIPADTREAVMGSMAVYLSVVLAGVMTIVLCMFGSVLLPFRLAFAIIFTLTATFGVVVIVYQTPTLHAVWPWLANYNGVCYQVIPMASCVAVALGIDYDIFLVSRISEYRMSGLSDSASIVHGVARTGTVISGAGLIMALAFSGMFFSDKLMHQQFALTLVTSVLLDTFVVRTVLVPALMMTAMHWNWWPRTVPDCNSIAAGDVELAAAQSAGAYDAFGRSRSAGSAAACEGGYSD